MPPAPRGGHSATLTGASLVIFGVNNNLINNQLGPLLYGLRHWLLLFK